MSQLGKRKIQSVSDDFVSKKIPTPLPSGVRLNHILMMQVFMELIHNETGFEEDKGSDFTITKLLLAGNECVNGFKGVLNYVRSLELASDGRTNVVDSLGRTSGLVFTLPLCCMMKDLIKRVTPLIESLSIRSIRPWMDDFMVIVAESAYRLKNLNVVGDKHHMGFDIFRPLKDRVKTVKIAPEFVANLDSWELDHVHVMYNQQYIPGFLDKIKFTTKTITIDTFATLTVNLLSNMNLAMFNDNPHLHSVKTARFLINFRSPLFLNYNGIMLNAKHIFPNATLYDFRINYSPMTRAATWNDNGFSENMDTWANILRHLVPPSKTLKIHSITHVKPSRRVNMDLSAFVEEGFEPMSDVRVWQKSITTGRLDLRGEFIFYE